MDTYEKKYKEIVGLIKKAYLYAQTDSTKAVLDEIFPELKESEDEKVRKALAEMVHDTTGDELWVDYNVHKEEALAWLEKQGEQKPTDKVEPKFNVGDAIKITGINNGHTGYSILNTEDGYYYNWKLIDKKTAWSEEDELKIKEIEEAYTNYCHGYTQDTILDWLKSLKQRIGG